MDKKQFVKEYCSEELMTDFLREQGIIWDGTNRSGDPFAHCSECVWISTELTEDTILAKFDITPLIFSIYSETVHPENQMLVATKFADFGSEWRAYMAKNCNGYLPAAKRYLNGLRNNIVIDNLKTREILLKGIFRVQSLYQKKMLQAETKEECNELSEKMSKSVNAAYGKIAVMNAETRAKVLLLEKVEIELDNLSEMKRNSMAHER